MVMRIDGDTNRFKQPLGLWLEQDGAEPGDQSPRPAARDPSG